jgi:hypothetical protein
MPERVRLDDIYPIADAPSPYMAILTGNRSTTSQPKKENQVMGIDRLLDKGHGIARRDFLKLSAFMGGAALLNGAPNLFAQDRKRISVWAAGLPVCSPSTRGLKPRRR